MSTLTFVVDPLVYDWRNAHSLFVDIRVLVIAAIVLWNTTYLERSVGSIREKAPDLDDQLLRFLSPLGWEHINLSGDYLWPLLSKTKTDKFRLLRRGLNP